MGTCPSVSQLHAQSSASQAQGLAGQAGGAGAPAAGKGPFFTLHDLKFVQKPLSLEPQAGRRGAEWVWPEAGPGSHSEATFARLRHDALGIKGNSKRPGWKKRL